MLVKRWFRKLNSSNKHISDTSEARMAQTEICALRVSFMTNHLISSRILQEPKWIIGYCPYTIHISINRISFTVGSYLSIILQQLILSTRNCILPTFQSSCHLIKDSRHTRIIGMVFRHIFKHIGQSNKTTAGLETFGTYLYRYKSLHIKKKPIFAPL